MDKREVVEILKRRLNLYDLAIEARCEGVWANGVRSKCVDCNEPDQRRPFVNPSDYTALSEAIKMLEAQK